MRIRQLKGLKVKSHRSEQHRSDGDLLASAITVIASDWRLSDELLGRALSIEPNLACQIRSGRAKLKPESETFASAQQFLRLFASLDCLFASDDTAARNWLFANNLDLGSRPIDLLDSQSGLSAICDYLEGFRERS